MVKMKPFIIANLRAGRGPQKIALLLTTTGRKSGLARITPLQFEEANGVYYVAAARGAISDWYRNIQADPHVSVEVHQRTFSGKAEVITDPAHIADFLALRLKNQPLMMGLLLRLEGMPLLHIRRADLERLAAKKALVAIYPDPGTHLDAGG
jgi:deazaflavin-dependent oxidoreductase (nitroreductase family)